MLNIAEVKKKVETLKVSEISLENIATSKVFIKEELAKVEELEASEILKTFIKEHFNFNLDIVKGLMRYHKEVYTNQAKSNVVSMEDYQQEMLKELEQAPKYVTVNSAQDFVEGRMMFTFYGGDTPFLVTSSKKIIKYDDVESYQIKIRNDNLPMSMMSSQTAVEFVRGKQVDILSCLQQLIAHIKKYVILQDEKLYTFLALWTMGTYMYRLFRYYPYIWINADKGSGKTRVMEVICPLTFNGMISTNQTQATIFRSVDADGCTLFIDEFEKMNDDMQQGILTILNSGFNVDSGKTARMEKHGDGYKRKTFNSYSPKVFAGISEISDVLQDRCVKVRMLKKNKDEHVARYKVDDMLKKSLDTLRSDLYICALNNASDIKQMYDSNIINFPNELSDRECDIWECIFVLSQFIDKKYNTSFEAEMKQLAIQGSAERTHDNVVKNLSYKLLNSLVEVVDTIKPVKESNGVKYYSCDAVFNMLKSEEDYDFLTSKRALTMELKTRFQISSSRLTIKGEKVAVYEMSDKYLEDLLERYNILTYKAESKCPAV